MRAAAINGFGGPEVIEIMDLPRPVVGPDTVLVKVAAAGVNPVDFKIREGRQTGRYPHHFPLILGWDVAGVVEEVGAAVTAFQPGDRVCAYARKSCVEHGTYAEYVTVVEESVSHAPSSVDLVRAAALPLASLTALQAMQAAGVAAGETVLVHGGAGGVGSFALQLLAASGARVLATGSARNHEYLRDLRAEPIDRHADLAAQVRELEPDGVDAMLDLAGGPGAVAATAGVVRDAGRVCSLLGMPDLGDEGPSRGLRAFYVFVRPYGSQLAELRARVDAGALTIPVHRTFPLEQAADAHRLIEQGGFTGKLALTVAS